jgi:hypothetical protein
MKKFICDINDFAFNQTIHVINEEEHKIINTTFDELPKTIAELVLHFDIKDITLHGTMAEIIKQELYFELGNNYNLINIEVVK